MIIWSVTFAGRSHKDPGENETFGAVDFKSLCEMLGERMNEVTRIERCGSITLPDGNSSEVVRDEDAIELAWGIIANAYGGDWDTAPIAWRQAAKRWRDDYVGTTAWVAAREVEHDPNSRPPTPIQLGDN